MHKVGTPVMLGVKPVAKINKRTGVDENLVSKHACESLLSQFWVKTIVERCKIFDINFESLLLSSMELLHPRLLGLGNYRWQWTKRYSNREKELQEFKLPDSKSVKIWWRPRSHHNVWSNGHCWSWCNTRFLYSRCLPCRSKQLVLLLHYNSYF